MMDSTIKTSQKTNNRINMVLVVNSIKRLEIVDINSSETL